MLVSGASSSTLPFITWQLWVGLPAHSLCGLGPDTALYTTRLLVLLFYNLPQAWSIRKPIILLLHKCPINRILYGFFAQPIIWAHLYCCIFWKTCSLYFWVSLCTTTGAYWGLGTLLLLSHSTSVYTKFQLHPKYLQQLLFLEVFIEITGCNAVLIYFSSHLDLLNIFNCACTTLFRNWRHFRQEDLQVFILV